MEWLLAVFGGAGVAGALGYARHRRLARAADARELARVRELAGDDVTHFGEQLSRLGETLEVGSLDDAARRDYQAALDAYEKAKTVAPRLSEPRAVSAVSDTLADGRYAMACVEARVAGQPVPERRTPCFFDPRHGPSAQEVLWTAPGHGTRRVPACAQDAARVAAGSEPEVYKIPYGELTVPYWEAGEPGEAYQFGFFGSAGVRATAIGLRMKNKGVDVGRGRRDPTIRRRRDTD